MLTLQLRSITGFEGILIICLFLQGSHWFTILMTSCYTLDLRVAHVPFRGWEINLNKIQKPSSSSARLLGVRWCRACRDVFLLRRRRYLPLPPPRKKYDTQLAYLDPGGSVFLTWACYSGHKSSNSIRSRGRRIGGDFSLLKSIVQAAVKNSVPPDTGSSRPDGGWGASRSLWQAPVSVCFRLLW